MYSEIEENAMSANPAAPPKQKVSPSLLWFSRAMGWACWLGIAATVVFKLLHVFGVIPTSNEPSNPMDSLLAYSSVSVGETNPLAPPPPDIRNDPFYIATTFVPPLLTIWALLSARRVFANIGQGAFFARSTSIGLRNLAVAVLLNMTVAPLITGVAHFAYGMRMKALGHHGELELNFGLSDTTMLILIFAGTVAIIASVMAHAARVAEENEQFV